mgnify:CR=1 FL=1
MTDTIPGFPRSLRRGRISPRAVRWAALLLALANPENGKILKSKGLDSP